MTSIYPITGCQLFTLCFCVIHLFTKWNRLYTHLCNDSNMI